MGSFCCPKIKLTHKSQRPMSQSWRKERDSNPRVLAHKLISSQPRYDHFDILPYLVVFEFCTAFARPIVKCVHSKFKKNEAFARKSKKTRGFAPSRVTRAATFRVIGSCCATHVMTTSLSPRRRRYPSVFNYV